MIPEDAQRNGSSWCIEEEYAGEVVRRHHAAFELWRSTSALYSAGIRSPRSSSPVHHLVLDMLMRQGVNAHCAVGMIAKQGLVEDAATLARRLLELSVQGVYIGGESDPKMQQRKAGMYIAFLWRNLPKKAKKQLPESIRETWSSLARLYGRFVPSSQKRWGPNWYEMFEDCGIVDLYRSDYSFLSQIAHGSSEEQVVRYSMEAVAMRDHRYVPVLVVYASKYLAVLGEMWNSQFSLIDDTDIEYLRKDLLAWTPVK